MQFLNGAICAHGRDARATRRTLVASRGCVQSLRRCSCRRRKTRRHSERGEESPSICGSLSKRRHVVSRRSGNQFVSDCAGTLWTAAASRRFHSAGLACALKGERHARLGPTSDAVKLRTQWMPACAGMTVDNRWFPCTGGTPVLRWGGNRCSRYTCRPQGGPPLDDLVVARKRPRRKAGTDRNVLFPWGPSPTNRCPGH